MYIPSLLLNTVLDVVVDDVATVEIDVVIEVAYMDSFAL